MTPLERAAKAAYDEWISPVVGVEARWEELPESHRSRMIESQRAALAEIASIPECDFPSVVVTAGRLADEECNTINAGLRASFRAMLKEIVGTKSN